MSQNYSPGVTHIIASRMGPADYKFRGQVNQSRDVICMEWLEQCEEKQCRLPVRPHQYLNLTQKTLATMDDVDRFGAP